MPEEEEYELTPHKQLEELKSEIEKLKSVPSTTTKAGQTLQESIGHLNDEVSELLAMFKYAKDTPDNSEIDTQKEILRKLETLIDENRKIAQGIVSLAEMIRKLTAQQNRPRQMQSNFGAIPPPLRAPPNMIQTPPTLPTNPGQFSNQPFNNQQRGNISQNQQAPPPFQSFPPLGNQTLPPQSNMPPPPFSMGQMPNTDKKKGMFG